MNGGIDTNAVILTGHSPILPQAFAVKRDVDNNISDEALRNRSNFESDACVVTQQALPGTDSGAGDIEHHKESSSGYVSESGDMLREMVKNKELEASKKKGPTKSGSLDSDISDTSNLVATFVWTRTIDHSRLIL